MPARSRQLQSRVALGEDVLGDEEYVVEIGFRDEGCDGEECVESRDDSTVLADRPDRRVVETQHVRDIGLHVPAVGIGEQGDDLAVRSRGSVPSADHRRRDHLAGGRSVPPPVGLANGRHDGQPSPQYRGRTCGFQGESVRLASPNAHRFESLSEIFVSWKIERDVDRRVGRHHGVARARCDAMDVATEARERLFDLPVAGNRYECAGRGRSESMQCAGSVEDDSTITGRVVAVLLTHEARQEGDGLVPRIRRDGERPDR